MKHEPMCPRSSMQCLVYHGGAPCPGYGECTCGKSVAINILPGRNGSQPSNNTHLNDAPCPLTNSSHEKALVRVVEKELTGGTEPISINVYKYKQDFIQVLCSCGHIISEAEIN